MTIRAERLAAQLEGDFVVFLIGMRINKPWRIDKWLPVMSAMPKMLRELYAQPQLGLLHHETGVGRTVIMVQYWRSVEQLLAYATNRDAAHLPAWQAFNKAIGTDGTVGIWHETYRISKGNYESIYANMPPFGLGKAGTLVPVTSGLKTARSRLETSQQA